MTATGRRAGPAAARSTGDPARERVLRAFVRDGRVVQMPAKRSKRRVLLEVLAQDFEPGRRYLEPDVNEILGRHAPDHASLRRYLVDEGLLDRDGGHYWRCGGPFDLDHPADADDGGEP